MRSACLVFTITTPVLPCIPSRQSHNAHYKYQGHTPAFLPNRLVSSALRTMYFPPAICKPVDWIFFGTEVSLYAPTTSCISWGKTVKPAEAAQTEVPSE